MATNVFYREFENDQKKDKKKFDPPESGDSNSRFSKIFLSMIWIFMGGEGDEIKKKASKWEPTLFSSNLYLIALKCPISLKKQ